ncbi:MAG: DUF349 domain-containing protein [Bacteroidales bacterium]|jgi:hypothetical protein|nr:DUF349 domain-containing protein [Bacteroidales bacterium]MDD4740227.1 DUF349 domain-containing protein [Bacteroidales bacterium]
METKDQTNQIPEESQVGTQDEKTIRVEQPKEEANQPVDQDQESAGEKVQNPSAVSEQQPDDSSADSAIADETPSEAASADNADKGVELIASAIGSDAAEEAPVVETADAPKSETATAATTEQAEPAGDDAGKTDQVVDESTSEPVAEKPDETEADAEPKLAEKPEAVVGSETAVEAEALIEPEAAADTTAQTAAVAAETADSDLEKTHDEEEDEEEEDEEEITNYEELSREQLIDQLEKLVAADDVNEIKSKVALIKVAFIKKTKAFKEDQIQESLADAGREEGQENEEEVAEKQATLIHDTLQERFDQLFAIYKQKRGVYLDQLEVQKQHNLTRKQQILEELKELIASEETLKKTYDDFRALQEEWKSLGIVPKAEVNNLWQNYHFLVEKFFDKVKINKELKDLDLKKNLEQKIELCERAEELLIESSIIKSFKALQRLHEQWKEVGPVPADKNEEIWERFKSTTDKINQRRRDHYKLMEDQHEINYQQKVALCEKAEQLLEGQAETLKQWQQKTQHFNELFKVWKTIGPAAKRQNDEVWERFRSAMDSFFSEKKEYFGKLKDQQINNYNQKLDLCVRAEALSESADWRQTTRELIEMQKEWKEIGPVPRKNADKIWKRFRTACDTFFNNKSKHFASIREDEGENLRRKEELIKLVEETEFGSDKSENLNKLKDFQRQWTDIGHVPFKDKDRLQNAFRNVVNKQLDKLNISSHEISLSNYRSRMESVKEAPDAQRTFSRERSFIQGKISSLRDDINVWENNIGFLADTKKANLFKDEFEKKINNAKEELQVLESKLKLINEA